MRVKSFYLVSVIALILPLFFLGHPRTTFAQTATPIPTSAASDSGPVAIVGQAGSANFYASPDTFPEPVVALLDVSNMIKRQPVFVSGKGQILGTFDTGMFPLPAKFSVNLPIKPTGASLDLDNNGKADAGVQVFALIVANNLTGDSYLQQLDQSGLVSYLTDVVTGAITEGAFLVHAPDASQSFPKGYGADKQWFTADDPAGPLPQGYTVARLSADGKVTLDRSSEPVISTIERNEVASPDFSKQGILESYNSLIDTLKQRYAYTELRKLDWEQIRAKYLPEVQKADAAKDSAAYFVTLNTLGHSIRDAHVAAVPGPNVEAILANGRARNALISGTVGAETIAVSDPAASKAGPTAKVVVQTVGKDTPAGKAGWAPGTEIVSIDGKPAVARFETLPLYKSVGTEEGLRAQLAPLMLRFPLSQTVTIGYRLPNAAKVMTATLTAGDYTWDAPTPPAAESTTPISYRQLGDTAVLKWDDFSDNMPVKIAVLEEALDLVKGASKPGVILDLRGNTGGAAALYMTMASYFFKADKPMPYALFDWYYYDEKAGGLIKAYSPDYLLSAPKPELAYTGPLVVLVDDKCASSCEYFSQHLQKTGRATVVGQYGTEGAGGPVDRIQLPGGLTFQYTMGRTTFAGTKEFNLEAKGVVPDIRVPVTLETEAAKLKGEDPVMQAAVAELDRQANELLGRLSAQPWQWVSFKGPNDEFKVETPKNYVMTLSKPEDSKAEIKTDCGTAAGQYSATLDQLEFSLEPATQGACPANSRGEQLLKLLTGATPLTYTIQDGNLQVVLPDGSTLVFAPVK
jgi:C-terminal processing protease CtpA/Prc